ncbi:Coenzyme F420 hydrogenase/dehydrogenase, beta subunit C-terminal domain [Clostridium ihumii]|uniref:Coenzyme F420 hydrogenase/dehydrogenase, beta subunit C-terminal domain n=1 Tax=Clostridium ihumii TaxID=1470356 RepID=UPI00058DD948|nr:Coenzyme F420 hydrogenase/dehydrogenase, beta subunit C-terminal domain [Clostridium ihumii]
MKQIYNSKKDCCGCTACYNSCPKNAISMLADSEGFLYPFIDETLCINCGICKNVCPLIKEDNFKNDKEPTFYVAKHKDTSVLSNSTSGGAFTAISDVILKENGLIYGVDFDDDFNIIHTKATNENERNRMRFSKYAQSTMNSIFKDVKADLISGKKVLFTGTPCQIAGLRSFIGNNIISKNLYTCDLICHSVPSPLIWKEYKSLLEKEHSNNLVEVFFRTKQVDWRRENSNKGFTYKIAGDSNYYTDNRFYQLFFNEMTIMRPSCENCPYTDIHRVSDITIADYWGIEKYDTAWYDTKGVSLISVSTEKGHQLLNEAFNFLHIEERNKIEALTEQNRLTSPVKYPNTRADFWDTYHNYGFEYISNYLKNNYK